MHGFPEKMTLRCDLRNEWAAAVKAQEAELGRRAEQARGQEGRRVVGIQRGGGPGRQREGGRGGRSALDPRTMGAHVKIWDFKLQANGEARIVLSKVTM